MGWSNGGPKNPSALLSWLRNPQWCWGRYETPDFWNIQLDTSCELLRSQTSRSFPYSRSCTTGAFVSNWRDASIEFFTCNKKTHALLERKGRKHGSTISNSAARTTVTANSPCANARLVKCPGCSGWTKLVHTLENHAIDHILWNEGAVLRIVVSNRTGSWTDCIVKNRPSLLYYIILYYIIVYYIILYCSVL